MSYDKKNKHQKNHKKSGNKPPHKSPRKPLNKHPKISGKHPDTLLFGLHPVRHALSNPNRTIKKIWGTKNALAGMADIINPKHHPTPQEMPRDTLDQLTNGAVHQGIVIETDPLAEIFLSDILIQTRESERCTLVILDHVTDPHNVGAIMRSAAAFGAKAVIVHKRYAPPITGTLAKSAVGAVEYIPLVSVQNLARAIEEIQEFHFDVVGFAEEGTDTLGHVPLNKRTALVLGAEGKGMRQLTHEKCDRVLKLPTQGPIGALNVSNAAAIALYETNRVNIN